MVSRSVEVDMKLDAIKKCIDELYEKSSKLEIFAGVINRKVDNIEIYRDYKEKRYEQIKEKILQIIGFLFFASGCFFLGVISGGIQWK